MKLVTLLFTAVLALASFGANAVCLSGCSPAAVSVAPVKVAAADPAPAADKGSDLLTLRDKVIAGADKAIARADRYIADPKSPPAGVLYAQKRKACYTTIKGIVPDLTVLNLSVLGDRPNGVLDTFEFGAEAVEDVASKPANDFLLSDVDKAKFLTDCGWIGRRVADIGAVLGVRGVSFARGAAGFLAPL